MTEAKKGVIAMIAAASIWGLAPLFFKLLAHVPALDVFAYRTLMSLVFFGLVLAVQGRLGIMRRALADRRTLRIIALATCLIAGNWYLFIWSIQNSRATEVSLGYYIYPLVAVLIGRVIFGERLARLQWVAAGLAVLAVSLLTYGLGKVPLIAVMLATTFGLYGLIKKQLDLGPVISVTCEVLLIAPVSILLLLLSHHNGQGASELDAATAVLLVLSGPVTAAPLILFSYGARRLAMATVGLLQYINPTMQFACAVFVFGEPFGPWHMAAFALIWTALALYSASALGQDSARRKALAAAAASGTAV